LAVSPQFFSFLPIKFSLSPIKMVVEGEEVIDPADQI